MVFIGSADSRVYAFGTQYVPEFATMIVSFLTWTILAIAVIYAKKRMERQVFAKSTARV
jgi:hypothetical protein